MTASEAGKRIEVRIMLEEPQSLSLSGESQILALCAEKCGEGRKNEQPDQGTVIQGAI